MASDGAQALESLREKIKSQKDNAKKPSAKQWVEPTVEQFAGSGLRVLSFDQTLSHTGWALINAGATPEVWDGGVLEPVGISSTSFQQTYEKAFSISDQINELVGQQEPDELVMEMPAVAGYRTESSLIGGLLVNMAARRYGLPVTAISNITMRALFMEPGNRTGKAPVKAAVEKLVPADQRSVTRWNEHVVDAVALGLTHIYRQNKEQL